MELPIVVIILAAIFWCRREDGGGFDPDRVIKSLAILFILLLLSPIIGAWL